MKQEDNGALDPFDSRYWYQHLEMLYFRPVSQGDPVAGLLSTLPFVNIRQSQEPTVLVDWTNSAALTVTSSRREDIFSTAEELANGYLSYVPPLGLGDDLSVQQVGYARAEQMSLKPRGLFKAVKGVKSLTQLSAYFRESPHSFCLYLSLETHVCLYFVGGELFRQLQHGALAHMSEQRMIRNYADYQARAIRREMG